MKLSALWKAVGICFGLLSAHISAAANEPAEQAGVIRPNLDTIYSHAWLDLSRGPVTLDIPAIPDRYFTI